LANERTYLAWVRTGITVIGLGFVVAKFGLIVREFVPSVPTTSFHFSSIVGIALVLAGALMELLALKRFAKNQERIEAGKYEPTTTTEVVISTSTFIIAILLIAYMVFTV
jgi:putative membrane protein